MGAPFKELFGGGSLGLLCNDVWNETLIFRLCLGGLLRFTFKECLEELLGFLTLPWGEHWVWFLRMPATKPGFSDFAFGGYRLRPGYEVHVAEAAQQQEKENTLGQQIKESDITYNKFDSSDFKMRKTTSKNTHCTSHVFVSTSCV